MSAARDMVWRESFRVRFFDTDPTGRASVPALCRFLQEAADSHCRPMKLSVTDLLADGRMWVLSRLALSFTEPPRLGEDVMVETWGSHRLGGYRAYRDFRMRDAAGRPIGEASSMWLILDPGTRRPLRLPESILTLRHPEWQTATPVDAVKLTAPGNAEYQETFKVGWRDLDCNLHANNVRYIEWMLESLPESVHRGATFVSLDIQFAGEGMRGQQVVSVAESTGDGGFRHSLQAPDGTVLALARTAWRDGATVTA